jgi:hypothetical protein
VITAAPTFAPESRLTADLSHDVPYVHVMSVFLSVATNQIFYTPPMISRAGRSEIMRVEPCSETS